MSTCFLNIGSITQAIKAKKVLAQHSIKAEIQKNGTEYNKGCVHGIEFGCQNFSNVKRILNASGIVFEERTQ